MVDENEEIRHHLKEIEQINLILKKLLAQNDASSIASMQHDIKNEELEKLEDLTSQLNEKSQKVKNSDSTSEFITKIHHELKTPLTPIKSYTDLLLGGHYGKLNDSQLQKINNIKNNISSLEDAMRSLFTKENLQNMGHDQNDQRIIKELKQEKVILKKLEESESKKLESSNQEITNLKNKLSDLTHDIREHEQEEKILEKHIQVGEQKILSTTKNQQRTIILSALIIVAIVSSYSVFMTNQIGEQYRIPNQTPIKSSYIIQNLQGDTINTWLSWRLVDGSVLHVNILDADAYPQKVQLIRDVILSIEAIEIDDSLLHKGPKGTASTYYAGWSDALANAGKNSTQFYIPENMEIIESERGEGHITIALTNLRHGDGYSGFTKSIADETQNQILKSEITIYEVDSLGDEEFKTILRHEMGHALGLAHSTAPEDLMHEIIQTEFPYISECDVDAIISLYDGSKKSEVVCEK